MSEYDLFLAEYPTILKNEQITTAIENRLNLYVEDFQDRFNFDGWPMLCIREAFFSVDLENIGLVWIYVISGFFEFKKYLVVRVKIQDVRNDLEVFCICNSKEAKSEFCVYDDIEYIDANKALHLFHYFSYKKYIRDFTSVKDEDILYAVHPPNASIDDTYILVRSQQSGIQYEKLILANKNEHRIIRDGTPKSSNLINRIFKGIGIFQSNKSSKSA